MENVSLSRAEHISTESRFAVGWLQKKHPCLIIHQIEHAPNWFFHQVRREPAVRAGSLSGQWRHWLPEGHRPCCSWPSRNWLRNFVSKCSSLAPRTRLFSTRCCRTVAGIAGADFFKSNLSPADIARELSRATILLLPTRADTSPTRSRKPSVAGVPVVASRRWGNSGLCHSGRKWDSLYTGQPGGICRGNPGRGRPPAFFPRLVTPSSLAASREYLSRPEWPNPFFPPIKA